MALLRDTNGQKGLNKALFFGRGRYVKGRGRYQWLFLVPIKGGIYCRLSHEKYLVGLYQLDYTTQLYRDLL